MAGAEGYPRRRRLGREPTGEPESASPPADADPREVAREIALRRLEQRAHTRAELRTAMLARGTPEAVADELLDRFEQVGLVDDAAFAQAWTASRAGVRHFSRRAVVQELRRKGVDDDLIADATVGIDREAELIGATQVAAAKRKTLVGLAYPVAYRRLAGALARKGYGPDVVPEVVRQALAGWAEPDGDGDTG